MRSFVISTISFAMTAGVIANAYYQKKQFYPSVVYITKSNPSMAVSFSGFCSGSPVRGAGLMTSSLFFCWSAFVIATLSLCEVLHYVCQY